MSLTPDQYCILQDLGCYDSRHALTFVPCEMARRMRPSIVDRIAQFALGEMSPVRRSNDTVIEGQQYLEALQGLLDWTYSVCQQAAREEGPYIGHVGKSVRRHRHHECFHGCRCSRCQRLGCSDPVEKKDCGC